jgi:hypothetical protein
MDKKPTSTDLSVDEFFEFGRKVIAERDLRRSRPWAYDICRCLWATRSHLSMAQLVQRLWELRGPAGLPMPKEFARTVQSELNRHTSQSSRWSRKSADDLFYSPEGKGSGTWAAHRDRAMAWVAARGLPPL